MVSGYLDSVINCTLAQLYDYSWNNIVESTTNTRLNEKLYSKLILSLEGAAKASEFWGMMKDSPSENVDAYFNQFQELLYDLAELMNQFQPRVLFVSFYLLLAQNLNLFGTTTESIIFLKNRRHKIGQSFKCSAGISIIQSNQLSLKRNHIFQMPPLIKKPIRRKSESGF